MSIYFWMTRCWDAKWLHFPLLQLKSVDVISCTVDKLYNWSYAMEFCSNSLHLSTWILCQCDVTCRVKCWWLTRSAYLPARVCQCDGERMRLSRDGGILWPPAVFWTGLWEDGSCRSSEIADNVIVYRQLLEKWAKAEALPPFTIVGNVLRICWN